MQCLNCRGGESAHSTKRPFGVLVCRVDILVDPYSGVCKTVSEW